MAEQKPLRLFISHVSTHKKLAADLAQSLKSYNVTPFVAHDDIEPTAAWQEEIEKFLESTDCMLALLNTGYSQSVWCNQEVGFCLGRGIPLISFRMEEDPKGFIGKWQAHTPQHPFNPAWEAGKAIRLIQKKAATSEAVRSWVINCFHFSGSFAATNDLCDAIEHLDLSDEEIQEIQTAFESNSQVRGANNIVKVLDEEWLEANKTW